MKKISYLELSSLVLAIILAFDSGINIYILKNEAGIDSWISTIIAYLIGIIPLLIVLYIANYQPNLNLFEKNIKLFGKIIGNLINIIIITILFIISITLLYNIVSFITTQFLYHTPMLITSSLLVLLAVYTSCKEANVISHVSLILAFFNLIIFVLISTSLTKDINFEYLLPVMKTPSSNIFTSALKISIINVLPLITILIIPKNNLTNKKKYNKSIVIAYIIGSLISFLITIGTLSVLGIHLVKTFEYSEYIVLKKIRLFGFLERIENIASTMWITQIYIYLTLVIYTISKFFIRNKHHEEELNYERINQEKRLFVITNTIIGVILIIFSNNLFPSITTFNNYLSTSFIYIIGILLIIYLIISIGILINNLSTKSKKVFHNLHNPRKVL